MKILIDIWHPSIYHIFKYMAKQMSEKGHTIVWTIKPKDILIDLLNNDNITFNIVSRNTGSGKLSLFLQLLKHTHGVFTLARKNQIDLFLGQSISIAWVGKILRKKSIILIDDDDDIVPLFSKLAHPFVSELICPDCIRFKKWHSKRILVNSYNELAYLHPNYFSPDESILEKYNLNKCEYIVMRFSALDAHHDKGVCGIRGQIKEKIFEMTKGYKVVASIENSEHYEIDSWDMHHILAFAKLVISDSQTMTAEAAVLGTPAIRYNSFVGKISYLEELEHRYGLTYGFKPGQEEKMYFKIDELLNEHDLDMIWKNRQEKMLAEKIDLSKWLLKYFEKSLSK